MARFKFQFWLDGDKDQELLLMEEIDHLKSQRSFTKTIRDGIRLIVDLRKGSYDVLFELFPHMKKKFSGDDDNGNGDDLKTLMDKIDQLAQIQLQSSTPQGLLMAAKESASGGPKPLGGLKKIAAPGQDEDDTDLLDIKKDTSTDAGLNFLRSAMALQQ